MISVLNKYLKKHQVDNSMLPELARVPDIIVVIPCYNEPQLLLTLESLRLAHATCAHITVELIVVINSGERTAEDVVLQNRKTLKQCQDLGEQWKDVVFLTPLIYEQIRHKHAGAGYARKLGMDKATVRFADCDKTDGVIVSLDADTLVDANYFAALYQSLCKVPKRYGAVIKFAHPLDVLDSPLIVDGIIRYELHLRYVNQALKYIGFPYAHHTIGSAFAVNVLAYAKHGGMNRQKGGEDFYFLNKLFPHGEFIELNDTCVFPASRVSDRVPFGTGPQLLTYIETPEILTYRLDAFVALKDLFDQVPKLYEGVPLTSIHPSLQSFLTHIDFNAHLGEILQHVNRTETFVKRFFQFFDAFLIKKYLNFVHESDFTKKDVVSEALLLCEKMNVETAPEALEVLMTYRKMESK